jgi:transcriptional regulator with XRE-family HTH domain
MGRTRNFADVIRARMAAEPALAQAVEVESFNSDIATKVYELRTEAGLTQKELADLVGSQQSVISRIEDADYDGHSISLLRRIAHALGRKLRVEFYLDPEVRTTTDAGFIRLTWSYPGKTAPYEIHETRGSSTAKAETLPGLPSGQGYFPTSSALVLR